MKHTDKDNALFEALNSSKLGRDFVDYANRVITEMCDVRTHQADDESKVAKMAAKRIQNDFIDKIKLRTNMEPAGPDEYE
jgi:hypothetical protein